MAWVAACQLCRLLYINEITNLQDYLKRLTGARDRLIAALHAVDPALLRKKGKLHLLYHLPTCVEMYGPLRSYMTEMHERQNGEIRARIQRTSKHNPSKDVHIRYRSECTFQAVTDGLFGYVGEAGQTSIQRLRSQNAIDTIINSNTSKPHLQHKIKKTQGVLADASGLFPNTVLQCFGLHTGTIHHLNQKLYPTSVHSSISAGPVQLFELVSTTDPTCIAKVGHSWVSYVAVRQMNVLSDVHMTSQSRIGKLILVAGNCTMSSGSFAVIKTYNLSVDTDLAHNPILTDAHHFDVVKTENITQVVNTQHHCTIQCHPKYTGRLRHDLRQFKVPEAHVQHDQTETRFVLNKHRLK